MDIVFYKTTSEPNKISKVLTDSKTVSGKLFDSFNVFAPVIVVRGKITHNYCYIDSLKRYFFVNEIKYDGDKAYIYLVCDVLMTYKDDVLNAKVHLTENDTGKPFISNRTNNYDVRPNKETISFDGEFMKSNIIMITLKGDK